MLLWRLSDLEENRHSDEEIGQQTEVSNSSMLYKLMTKGTMLAGNMETSFVNPLPQYFETENNQQMIAYTMLAEQDTAPSIYFFDIE